MIIIKVTCTTHVSVESERYIIRETNTIGGETRQWFRIKNGLPEAMSEERAADLQAQYDQITGEAEPPDDTDNPDDGDIIVPRFLN